MKDLSLQKIKFPKREKYKKHKLWSLKETIPTKRVTEIIDLSKNYKQKFPKNEPLEEESPKELSTEKDQAPKNNEISIQYVHVGDI